MSTNNTNTQTANTTGSVGSMKSSTSSSNLLKKDKEEAAIKVSNVPAVFVQNVYINQEEENKQYSIPFHERPQLTGETEIEIPHMHDNNKPKIKKLVSNMDLSFHPQAYY